MKKFLLFLVIAIASISIGLTIYYFSTDNEVILIKNSYIVCEKGDTISVDDLVEFKYRDNNTKLTFSPQNTENEGVLSYNANEGFFTASEGGESKIVVKTTNRNYSELIVNVLVCDGSKEYPYIISDADSLSKIGKEGSKYSLDKSYKLGANIAFPIEENVAWTPLSDFSGTFDGNYYSISNITITDASVGTNSNVGFVSTLNKDGVIKNLYLRDIKIEVSNKACVGAVAGQNKGTIMTTEVTGEIVSKKDTLCYVGGIAGKNESGDTSARIDRCGFEGLITTTGSENINNVQVVGGVVGHNYGSVVSESYFRIVDSKILSFGSGFFGGIVGVNEGRSTFASKIYDSYCYLQNGIYESIENIYDNVGGIVYNNVSGDDSTNVVMGNYYYCGDVEGVSKVENGLMGSNRFDIADKDKIDGRYNGFLTKEQFANSNKTTFVTYIKYSTNEARYWAFDSVWEMGKAYPILNIRSATGSTYPTDSSDIKGEDIIDTPQELYDKLSANPNGSYVVRGTKEGDIWVMDFAGLTWSWGDNNHPLFAFNGVLTGPDGEGSVIRNLNIVNYTKATTDTTVNVGLFTTLGTNENEAQISRLKFEDVTITYNTQDNETKTATNVGVLAGVSNNATITKVYIDGLNVELNGTTFGGIVGIANAKTDKYFSNITIKSLDASNACFVYAGGIAGKNYTRIDVEGFGNNFEYNTLIDVKLIANVVGGVAGQNEGTIKYVDASEIKFNVTDSSSAIFSKNAVAVGGIAGINKGTISNVYANLNAETVSGQNYVVHMGGLVGYNYSDLSLGYASGVKIKVTNNYTVRAGGLVGSNTSGKITRCVVEKGSIDCSIENHNNDIQNLKAVSVVGGLVGMDGRTTNQYTISECATYITSIKGAFAGGLAGDANGVIEKSHCGDKSRNVEITGFIVGGLAGVVPGKISDSFTVCTLSGQYTDNSYSDANSIIQLKVSVVAGFTGAMMGTDSEIKGCYAVANFKNGGLRVSTCPDLGPRQTSNIVGGIYTIEGTAGFNKYGKLISESDLNGTNSTGYQLFFANIGSTDTSVWDTSKGGYPRLYNVDENLPTAHIVVE